MRIKRYDRGFSRRTFMERLGQGVIAAGLFGSPWRAIADTGEAACAYPDELLSIEEYTCGKVSPGDAVTADNVDLVKDLLDPARFRQVKEMGRQLNVIASSQDVFRLSPYEYVEATLRNAGKARFDATGNVVTEGGKPWIGGNPFPDPKSALEAFAGLTLSWGRHDVSVYASKEYDLDEAGNVVFDYDSVWAELAPVARVAVPPLPYWPGHEHLLRYQAVLFTAPNNVKGTSYLNTWPYDQNKFPDLEGYLPAFKRIRRFPTNQRFEPLIPGSTLYLSDAWAAGDPFLTWGNYRIVHRGPALAALSDNWASDHPNWEHGVHGGPKGQTFWNTNVELVPEAIVVEAEPVMFKRAPVGKKRVWLDTRTLLPFAMVSFDRRGNAFRSFDGAFALYQDGDRQVMDGNHPYWSWTHLHAHNLQTDHITRIEQVYEVGGGHRMMVNDQAAYERYLTRQAMMRNGR